MTSYNLNIIILILIYGRNSAQFLEKGAGDVVVSYASLR